MKKYFITIENSVGTPYDFEVEASGPEDVMRQIVAMNAGLRMGLARIPPPPNAGGAWRTPTDLFALVNLSTTKTRKHEYIKLSEWVKP